MLEIFNEREKGRMKWTKVGVSQTGVHIHILPFFIYNAVSYQQVPQIVASVFKKF
jgi:hypothetical protein